MHPILLSFGNFTIYTYGLFVALGFLAATIYISYRVQKSKNKIISLDDLYTLFIYAILAAVLGARLLYVLINIKSFAAAPLDIIKVWEGGLVYYGGFALAVLTIIIFCRKKKIPLGKLSDLLAPAIALGHFFGRIGCFFAGCCYGKVCELPWAVVFNNEKTLAMKGAHLHPTQLYEAFGNLIFFVLLHFYNKKKQHPDGMAFALYLIGYSVLRFIIEFFRGDYRGAEFLGMSVAQNFSIIIFITGLIIIYKVNKNARNNKI